MKNGVDGIVNIDDTDTLVCDMKTVIGNPDKIERMGTE